MARSKKNAEPGFGDTVTQENKNPPHCGVCGAVFGSCDHTKEQKANNLPAVAGQQAMSPEQLSEIARSISEPRTYPPTITKALVAITKAIPVIDKLGENTFHKYNYARSEDVIAGVRDLMLEHNIILLQEQKPGGARAGNGVYVIDYWFTFIHTNGEAYPPMEWSGACKVVDSKGVADDKAVPKCHTQAEKYFLIKQFKIKVRDLPDGDADEKVPDGIKGTTRDPTENLPVEPHLIVANPGTAQNWQRLYLVAIRRAKTPIELTAWTKANAPQMAKLREKAEPLFNAAAEAVLRRYQELAEQPAGQKPLPPRADGQPNPTQGQSNTSSAQAAAASTSIAASTHVADPAGPGSKNSGQFGPMEEQTMLDGWGNMLSLTTTIEEINALQVNHLDKIKLRMSGMGYAKAQYAQQMRIKQIQAGHVSEDAWDFDSWFRTDFLGALSSCAEGDVERLDHVQQKVVIPARGRMTDTQWKQTAKKFREEAARIKGDEL